MPHPSRPPSDPRIIADRTGARETRLAERIPKNLGDGLLISFGWPAAREDDPERAVRAGVAIVDAMVPLKATLAAGDGTRLAVRIGMHTGPLVMTRCSAKRRTSRRACRTRPRPTRC